MKVGWRYGAFFLLLYIVALVVNLPARLLTRWLPQQVQAIGPDGNVWHGELRQLRWQSFSLRDVRWHWQWSQGLPAIRITGQSDAGQGGVTLGWAGSWRLSNGHWQMPVQTAVVLSGMPLPFSGEGDLVLKLERLRFAGDRCLQLSATLVWDRAILHAGEQRVMPGEPQIRFHCQPRQLQFELSQSKEGPHLAGKGHLDASGAYAFNGRISLPDDLPAIWRQVVENTTRADNNGQRIIEASGIWTLPHH